MKEYFRTNEEWEVSADAARCISNSAPLRKLNDAKKRICEEISKNAFLGRRDCLIDFDYYEVSCPEDWCNIYGWLLRLGYKVQDNSAKKLNPNFIVYW